MHKVDIMLVTKDRPSEVALLLQSLRTQTFQNWDLFICDDRSGIPLQAHHFLNMILNRLKLENHIITMWRNDIPLGVTRLRKNTMEKIMKYGNGNLVLRLDDDNIDRKSVV